MTVRVCVLGSGSRGNATLLMTPETHVLIDAASRPRMTARLHGTGATWSRSTPSS